ncbi:hypothetical protein [Dyadobacter jiangsuensis]|uniref:C1q domain-containing protein n=1 Tax=Dyadobacter jiangsuensis TaxID=1591085 RepID=A0A2P8GC37_9BACT|nr:hypothetical protein [Dyadobacter jiangsuensis]PSL31536.1 hypothetical protein CLV60_103402 [Dyadobacter jiangsuensis]
MTTKRTIKGLIGGAVATIFLAAAPDHAFAQVKIGSNPTVIGSNSNLEVEATNAKKVIVHKSDGTVVIENTPQGAATDKLMSVDAAGNVRALTLDEVNTPVATRPYLRLKGAVITAVTGSNVFVTNLAAELQNNVNYTAGTGAITIQEAGVYYYAVTALGPGQAGAPGTVFDYCHAITANNATLDQTCGRSNRGEGTSSTNTGIYKLNAGDVVRINLTTSSAWVGGTGQYNFSVALYKLSN